MKNIHGQISVYLEGQIIHVNLKGQFNELGVREFTNKIKECVSEVGEYPFAILINDLEMEGGTPEAYQELELYNRWLNTQNLVAKAMVIESALQLKMIDRYSPSREKQNIQSFTNEAEALRWLQQELESENPS